MSLLKIAVVYDGLSRVPGVGTERRLQPLCTQTICQRNIDISDAQVKDGKRQLNNVVNYTSFYSWIKITLEPVFAVTAQYELQNAITF